MAVGAWSEYRPVTDEDREVVKEAYEGIVDFHFEPFSVSTQVVEGVNYHFVGTAGATYPGAPRPIVTVRIFKAKDAKAVVV